MASTVDSRSFSIDEIQNEENFLLSTTQTRTAYRQESVTKTCFRTEVSYRNQCSYYPEVRCYETRDSARICNTASVYRCSQQPEYRNVPYLCNEIVSIPYEVIDHLVKTNFNIKISSHPKEPTNPTNCRIGFTMIGDLLKSNADCNSYLIVSNEHKSSDLDQTGTVIHNYNIQLKLLDAQTILAPLEGGIADMHLDGHTLIFRTGDLSKNANFSLKLFIEKKFLLKSDESLIDRNITPNEYQYEKLNERFGIVKVNLDKLLGGFNDTKKHAIKVSLSIKLEDGKILNTQIPTLTSDSSIIVNN